MMRRALAGTAAALVVLSADAGAQSLRSQCATFAADGRMTCEALADAALTLPPRVAVAAAGINPVSGTASTLGMRMPGSPRWSLALRGTVAPATLPPIGAGTLEPTPWSVHADFAVGLFNGFHLLPTVGGFGSIDVLGSIGLLSMPEDEGFEQSSPLTWALGARLGILRESFTAPGVSISGMYRSLPDISFGAQPDFAGTSQSVLSVRGTVGKRVLGIGLTGGVGYDRVRSDVRTEFVDPVWLLAYSQEERDVVLSRANIFGSLSYTLMILNLAVEVGWQEAGDRPGGAHRNTGKGGPFGGIAVRLAI